MTGTMPLPRPVTPTTILAQALQGLVARMPEATEPGWQDELRAAAELAAGLDPYLDRYTTAHSAALDELAVRTQQHDWNTHDGEVFLEQEMLSGHVEGQFLSMLVHATRAEHLLEIGMFTGYSTLAMAEALPDGGTIIACEIDPGVAAFAQECFAQSEAAGRITVRVGDALTTLTALAEAGAVFDLIFVDADKAGYRAYVDAVLDHGLLAEHGLICVDNTLLQGQPWTGDSTTNGTAIAEFNEAIARDPRVSQVIVPLRDGITLIRQVDSP